MKLAVVHTTPPQHNKCLLSKKSVKCLRDYQICGFVVLCSEEQSAVLCKMFSIYKEILPLLRSHPQLISLFCKI